MTTNTKILNPFTGELDYLNFSPAQGFDFVENGNDLELWWKGQLIQSWTYVPPVLTGEPIGLLLALTYA